MSGSGGPPQPPLRSPLLDPRLAGAGGMLLATAALAWLLTQGGAGNSQPTSTCSPVRGAGNCATSAPPGEVRPH